RTTDADGLSFDQIFTISVNDVAEIPPPTVTSVVVNGNDPALVGAQRSMVTNVLYTFSNAVLLDADAITIALHNNSGVFVGTLPGLTLTPLNPDANGRSTQWVVTFSGPSVIGGSIADGVYDLTVAASKVHDAANQGLPANVTTTIQRFFG